jgi:LuxR family maltose regulon positive regulatory protein
LDGFSLSASSDDVPPLEQLLRTKLHIPSTRAERVIRPRLISRINKSLGCKLTLLSAPVGYGKTTLLSEWIHTLDPRIPVAWFTVDERDNDPVRFATYFAAAIHTFTSCSMADFLSGVDSNQFSPDDLLTTLINTIYADLPGDFVLVLDDYHLISSQPIHKALGFILENMPPQMHLVISTRVDPPLPMAQLRARGQLIELRASHLRFSIEEETAFLNQIMGLHLSKEEITELDTRIEGWIAGMQLAALSIRECEDVQGFIQAFTGTHRHIVDYLTEQVLMIQATDYQSFLLETSILDRFSGPLCDAVTGKTGGQAMLEQLEVANLFIVPLDDERRWYRYHHLFSDILRNRLNMLQPNRILELNQRASKWYEHNNLMEDAVQYALKANDYDRAMSLIEQVTDLLWERNEIITVLNWMKALPEELMSSHPHLGLTYAVALANTGQLDLVEPLLQSVEAQLKKGDLFSSQDRQSLSASDSLETAQDDYKDWHYATPEGLLSMIDIRRAFVARYSKNLTDAIAFSTQALSRIPPDNLYIRGIAWLFYGHAHLLTGDAKTAGEALTKALADSHTSGHLAAYLNAVHFLAQLRILQGRLHESFDMYQQAMHFVATQKSETVFAGIERVGMGDLLREWNDLEAASQNIHEGLHLTEQSGDFEFLRDGYIARARLCQAMGDLDGALDAIRRSAKTVRRSQPAWDTALIEAWKARFHLAQGDLGATERWVQGCGLTIKDEPCFLKEFGHMTLARVLLAQGRLSEAGHLLDRLLQAAEAAGRMGRVIELLILRALTLYTENNAIGALEALKRALTLAEPEGYIRTFIDEGAPMAELILLGNAHNVWDEPRLILFVDVLLSNLGIAPVDQSGIVELRLQSPFIEPLSERELQVLQLVAEGASNKEIAHKLSITLSTVKAHLRNINSKLDVGSRTQAVARARSLRLLP